MIITTLILFTPILTTGVAFFVTYKFVKNTCLEVAYLRMEVRRVLVSQRTYHIYVSKTRLV